MWAIFSHGKLPAPTLQILETITTTTTSTLPMPTERVVGERNCGARISGHRPGRLLQRPVQHRGPRGLSQAPSGLAEGEGPELRAVERADCAAESHAVLFVLHSGRPGNRHPTRL